MTHRSSEIRRKINKSVPLEAGKTSPSRPKRRFIGQNCKKAYFVTAVGSICVVGETTRSVGEHFLSQRVISEGGMIHGIWSISGARAQKRCI